VQTPSLSGADPCSHNTVTSKVTASLTWLGSSEATQVTVVFPTANVALVLAASLARKVTLSLFPKTQATSGWPKLPSEVAIAGNATLALLAPAAAVATAGTCPVMLRVGFSLRAGGPGGVGKGVKV
jgi:hypothetical protein